jgi:hypothetical protein
MRNKNYIIKILVILILLIIAMQAVTALGVVPARTLFKIEEGKTSGTLKILNNQNQDLRIAVYATGEYASAITLDPNVNPIIKSDESERIISYTVNFPENLPPGRQEIDIVILELPSDSSGINQAGVVATTSVIAKILVDVPYPGKYIQSKLHVDSANTGDITTFSVSLFGKGDEDINNIGGTIIIKGPTNEELTRLETNSISLDSGEDGKITANWKASVAPGLYYAEAVIVFDGQQIIEREVFVIGDKSLKIANLIIDKFKLGQIAKVDVIAESVWNEEIKEVHAELDVFDESGTLLQSVKTAAVNIPSLGKEILSGYWDTGGMSIGNYDINVKLIYENEISEKLFQAVINADNIQLSNQALTAQVIAAGEEKKSSTISLLIVAVIVLIIINVSWFVYFKKFRKKKVQGE